MYNVTKWFDGHYREANVSKATSAFKVSHDIHCTKELFWRNQAITTENYRNQFDSI